VGSGETIGVLVVDESHAFLRSTTRWIESRPDLRLVGSARSGPEALEVVERERPDLVIVEAVLAGMDGFRLARALKQLTEPPMVLLVTFHATAAGRDEAMASGADGFLAKYDFSDEIETVLEELRAARGVHPGRVKTPARPDRRESRIVPDP
jgi:DNA-binding NarL/FixJ family response regulator